jgi:hypothetical protein
LNSSSRVKVLKQKITVCAKTEEEMWTEEIRNGCKCVVGKYRRDVLGILNVG